MIVISPLLFQGYKKILLRREQENSEKKIILRNDTTYNCTFLRKKNMKCSVRSVKNQHTLCSQFVLIWYEVGELRNVKF